MLKDRLLTAFILIILMALAIAFLPMPWFALLVGLVMLGAAWEWSSLAGFRSQKGRSIYVLIVTLALVIAYYLPIHWVLGIALAAWIWAAVAIVHYSLGRSALGLQYPFLKAFMGVLVLVPCWLAINVVRETVGGPFWLFFGFMLIWATDTGAYIAGRAWGKHALTVRVSPKKTWEGLGGGILLTLLVAVVVSASFRDSFEQMAWVSLLALVTALFAVLGDLLESLLKRQAGIKDSGGLLPGHGGILDRIDSTTAALPIFALGSLWLGG
ncbi:MAG: phosphatidate cytidylyltransferase [Coxiella sp. RIFCSPHIGHO2_12_FULL_44_14]|nr:MAG: phosphatidate cytidylyltransferase [Coxiella sp. RIFCSPHIGHO2_12_FULL_44_14]